MTQPTGTNRLRDKPFEEWPDDLTPAEVASLFRVDPKTVNRWEAAGKIESWRTPGNHRRFTKQEVYDLWKAGQE